MTDFIKITIAVMFVVINGEINGQQCKIPNGNAGTCMPIKACTPVLNYSRKAGKTTADVMFLQQISSVCGNGIKQKVCCPHKSQWHTFVPGSPVHFPVKESPPGIKEDDFPVIKQDDYPVLNALPLSVSDDPDPDNYLTVMKPAQTFCQATLKSPQFDSACCGLDATFGDRIIGGNFTALREYPWQALLVYVDGIIGCGGSLISSRYVLTAAHCVGDSRYGPVRIVRLAEYNTSSYPTDYVETDGGGIDQVTVLEITVERQIRHPQYTRRSGAAVHDIALVKLSRNAPFTEFIRPVCLPTYDATLSAAPGFILTAAGWGNNNETVNTVKQKVQLPLFDKARCKMKYPEAPLENQLCAGGTEGKDTCSGDSGGPLVYEDVATSKTMIVGVVSFGLQKCGTKDFPGVYTNVFKYIDWINKETI